MERSMEQQQVVEEKKRSVPGWVAGAGAAGFLLLVGGFIYWFMGGSFGGTGDLIPDPGRAQQMATRGRGFRQPVNLDGVKAIPNMEGGYYVKSGPALMDVIPGADKTKPTSYRFRYDSQGLLTPEQFHLVMGLRRVGTDAKMAETLDVSREQLDRLRKYGYIPMELAKGDHEKLMAAWGDYEKATAKDEPEKKLVALLKDAGNRAMAATKVRANERIGEISRVLTPEQVRELTKLGAGQAVTAIPHGSSSSAATKPTTRAYRFRLPATKPTTRPV